MLTPLYGSLGALSLPVKEAVPELVDPMAIANCSFFLDVNHGTFVYDYDGNTTAPAPETGNLPGLNAIFLTNKATGTPDAYATIGYPQLYGEPGRRYVKFFDDNRGFNLPNQNIGTVFILTRVNTVTDLSYAPGFSGDSIFCNINDSPGMFRFGSSLYPYTTYPNDSYQFCQNGFIRKNGISVNPLEFSLDEWMVFGLTRGESDGLFHYDNFRIGVCDNRDRSFWGDIAMILGYSRILSPSEIEKVEAYLMAQKAVYTK